MGVLCRCVGARKTDEGVNRKELFRVMIQISLSIHSLLIPTYGTVASHENGFKRSTLIASESPEPRALHTPSHTHKHQAQQKHNNSTMVSTKLLRTLSPSTILPKPRLRRSIPFGSSYANAYGYEKLSNEDESKSLIGSINSYDSCISSSSGGTLHDVPADDDSTAVCSVSSVLFSIADQSMSSDECSYSYSLCSKSFLKRGSSSRAPFKQYGEDGNTIDTSDYSNCTFDLSFMSRHAGLDYNGRTPPRDTTSSVKATTLSSDDMPREPLPHNDEDILEGARIVKEHFRAITCHQLEKTFDSDIDEDLSTSAKLLPGSIRSVEDEHKRHSVRKWLRRRNPVSALMRSLTSPAA